MTRNSSSVLRRYTFGPYTLDPIRRLLWRDGTLVPLTPKTVDVLAALVERHGQVVDKDDLLRFVWPNTVVEENNLARHISILRKALQQRRGQHDFISTIPGHGYLFVPAVAIVDHDVGTHAGPDADDMDIGRAAGRGKQEGQQDRETGRDTRRQGLPVVVPDGVVDRLGHHSEGRDDVAGRVGPRRTWAVTSAELDVVRSAKLATVR